MDCRTRSRILLFDLIWGREMGEKRETAPYVLHEYEGRLERELENGTTKQKNAKSNG